MFDDDIITDSSPASKGAKKKVEGKRNVRVTPEQVNNILVDRYHNGVPVNDIKSKYNISHSVWRELDTKFGPAFKEKFGVKAKSSKELSMEDMASYWKSK